MNEDKKIQELFDSFNPALTDSELFKQRLERKLAMIDEIRQAQTKQIRRYRMAVVAAFVAGIVLGSGLLVFILAIPSDNPLFTFGINFYPLQFIEQNSDDCVLHHCHDEYQRNGEQNKRQGNVTKQENRDAPFDVDNFLYDNSTLYLAKTPIWVLWSPFHLQ